MVLGAVLAVAAGLLVSYSAAAVVLVVGGAGAFMIHRREVEACTTRLAYSLDGEAAALFDDVRDACKALSSAHKIWCIEEDTVTATGSSDGTVLTFDKNTSRHPVEVGAMKPPGISANVEI